MPMNDQLNILSWLHTKKTKVLDFIHVVSPVHIYLDVCVHATAKC